MITADQGNVLIVDDTPPSLAHLARILEAEGYRVRPATNGPLALRAAEAEPPDLILLDVKMPDMDGFEVCRRLRAMAGTREVPVIFISALDDTRDKTIAFEVGGVDYIGKPFQPEEVLARVKAHLSLHQMRTQLERKNIELREARNQSEEKVLERTAELEEANTELRREIAERARAEEELHRLGLAVEQGSDTIVITDTEGTITYVNRAFENVTGYSREEVIGRNPRMIKSGEHDEAFYRELWETIARGEVWTGRFVNKRRDGSRYVEDATISPVRDASGTIISYVGVKRDVTRTLQLEEQLHHAMKMEAVGQLAGGVAHDFNNLLTAITGYAELARTAVGENRKVGAMLEGIEDAAQQAAGVTRSLLTFSCKTAAKKERVELHGLVEKTVRLLSSALPAGIDLSTELPGGPPVWVLADATQLQQVVMNLAINARDAMPDGGKLRISVTLDRSVKTEGAAAASVGEPSAAGAVARLVVADTGVGIGKGVQERIFEPFFTTKPRGRGTGLGLAIIHGIVTDHGGRIEVRSEVGQGAEFTVTLPALEVPAEIEPHGQGAVAVTGHGELVVLTEDSWHVRRILATALTSRGYRVIEAHDGPSLIESFQRFRDEIRLFVTDVDLPRRGGLDCLRDFRSQGVRTPAIIITGGVDADVEDQLDEQMVLLRKPFQVCELETLAGRLLGAEKEQEQESMKGVSVGSVSSVATGHTGA